MDIEICNYVCDFTQKRFVFLSVVGPGHGVPHKIDWPLGEYIYIKLYMYNRY